MKAQIRKLFSIIIILVSLITNNYLNTVEAEALPSVDHWPTNGWRSSTPEEQGMDSEKLADMLEYIKKKSYTIDSVTIVRNGHIVTDAYLNPLFNSGKKHIIHSCTKSITSALMGIVIDKGYVKDVDQPVIELFPEKNFTNMDERKKAITIEHLLTMSHGIRCMDSFVFNWQGLIEMRNSKDWVKYILDQPMDEIPGKRYDYSNMSSFLLSAIIHKQTNTSTLSFARKHLFEPLGITDVKWPPNPNGIHKGWGEMWLTPHDMAKIGFLYLHNGYWENKQIVPVEWVKESTQKKTFPKSFRRVYDKNGNLMLYKSCWVWGAYNYYLSISDGYGYQWWIDDSGIYSAVGYGGQYIMVVPEKNMVVVFTSVLKDTHFSIPGQLLKKYIIPSVSSNNLIPPNTTGLNRLKSLLKTIDHSPEPVPVPPLPETAQKINGKTYLYNANKQEHKSISLTFQPNKNVALLKQVIGNNDGFLEIGLDNVYRVTDFGDNQIALKGNWIDKKTFTISYDYIGNTRRGSTSITFENNKMVQSVNDVIQGKIKFSGQTEE